MKNNKNIQIQTEIEYINDNIRLILMLISIFIAIFILISIILCIFTIKRHYKNKKGYSKLPITTQTDTTIV